LRNIVLMTRRILLVFAVALVALGVWLEMRRPFTHHAPVARPAPQKAVPIQDGKTIDFSSGKAVVSDDAKQKAALDRAVAEIDAATANVTFQPQPTPTTAIAAPAKK
jgi:hypothetical protein